MTKKELIKAVKELSDSWMVIFLIMDIQKGLFKEKDYYRLKKMHEEMGLI